MILTWRHSIGVTTVVLTTWYATSVTNHSPWLVASFFAALYCSGVLPTPYFPPIFSFLYTAYTSTFVGLRLKDLLHPRCAVPHSNFRNGCRFLKPLMNDANSDPLEAFRLCCASRPTELNAFVVPVPILADNYAYLCFCPSTKSVVAIDPADPVAVLKMIALVCSKVGIWFQLTDVLCTHKHWDHAGGNQELLNLAKRKADAFVCSNLRILGSSIDRPHGATVLIDPATTKSFVCGAGALSVRPVSSPGHTVGSLLFVVSLNTELAGDNKIAIFTGDCVFCGGCGALFEVRDTSDIITTYDAFHNDFLVATTASGEFVDPRSVMVYVGHEYSERLYDELVATATSRKWKPSFVAAIHKEYERIKALRKLKYKADGTMLLPQCTVPSTLDVERAVNPLLSLKREALVSCRRQETRSKFLTKPSIVEQLIYVSDERR